MHGMFIPTVGACLAAILISVAHTSSRRRKSKCDGIRPRCKRCANRNVTCVWSMPDSSQDSRTASLEPASEEPPCETSSESLEACLKLFFDRHFACDFCSFDHRPSFKDKCMQNTFLSSAVIALCGRYLDSDQAQALFRLRTGSAVSMHYLTIARSFAKAASDQPTGRSLSSLSAS